MALIDTLYDILSGVAGTLFGVALTTAVNYRRNKRMTGLLTDTQNKLDNLTTENSRLMGVIQEKENRILDLEHQILQSGPKRKRGK